MVNGPPVDVGYNAERGIVYISFNEVDDRLQATGPNSYALSPEVAEQLLASLQSNMETEGDDE